jgi:hypothetical protein
MPVGSALVVVKFMGHSHAAGPVAVKGCPDHVTTAGDAIVTVMVAVEEFPQSSDCTSPTDPAFALSAATVPTMPEVVDGVIVLVATTVVNLPAAGDVVPMAGGLAKYVLKPVPLTVDDAASVVKDPAAAADPPMAGGLAKYVLKPVPLTVDDALSVVNAPPAATVPPIAGGLANRFVIPVPLTVDDAPSVVKEPAAATVPPMAGGLAKYVLKPVPLTVDDALSVVKAPAAGADPPMAAGLARYVLRYVLRYELSQLGLEKLSLILPKLFHSGSPCAPLPTWAEELQAVLVPEIQNTNDCALATGASPASNNAGSSARRKFFIGLNTRSSNV